MSSEIDSVLELLRALLDGEEVGSSLLRMIDSLIEKNELLVKRARGVTLSLLERERRLLEDIKSMVRAVKVAKRLASKQEASTNNAPDENSREVSEGGRFVLIEVLRENESSEFGAIRKGDIVATTKERAERLKREGTVRIIRELR